MKSLLSNLFRITIPGLYLATLVMSYLRHDGLGILPIANILTYYESYTIAHWIVLVVLAQIFGNLMLYLLDVLSEKTRVLSFYDYLYKRLFNAPKGEDILFDIRDDVHKYIKRDFPALGDQDIDKAKTITFKLLNQYDAYPTAYQTWIIFSRGMIFNLLIWSGIALFSTSILDAVVILILGGLFTASLVIVNHWVGGGVLSTYYINKRLEEIATKKKK